MSYAGGDYSRRYYHRSIDCVEFMEYAGRHRWPMSQMFLHEFHNNEEVPDESFKIDPACDWWDRQIEHEPTQAPIGDKLVVPRHLRNMRPVSRTKAVREHMSETAKRIHAERRAGTFKPQHQSTQNKGGSRVMIKVMTGGTYVPGFEAMNNELLAIIIAYAAIIQKRLPQPIDFQI